MNKISYDSHCAYVKALKKEDVIFTANIMFEGGSRLTVTNNHIVYAGLNAEPVIAADTKFAFLIRELFLYAGPAKFLEASKEIDEQAAHNILKTNINKTIVVGDESKNYYICADSYENIKNPKSVEYFVHVTKIIENLLKKYKYIA